MAIQLPESAIIPLNAIPSAGCNVDCRPNRNGDLIIIVERLRTKNREEIICPCASHSALGQILTNLSSRWPARGKLSDWD
jgi:hypothetical protein